jgi:iron complex outermembrane recepter protein
MHSVTEGKSEMKALAIVRQSWRRVSRTCLVAAILILYVTSALAVESQPQIDELSLAELLQVEVTSVAKQPQGLYDAPAAVFVITSEDIRRSGATSLPEVLRLTPGIQVARINSNVWAVTARGFNGRYANKLLVLQDGRSLYNPIFSGVFWNTQDLLLEDIERIEIIRGPVAALWGANAVNGVINILTKAAVDTQGTLITTTVGDEERYILGARQGFRIDDQTYLRLYSKGFERDSSRDRQGTENADDWGMLRGGFRLDRDLNGNDKLTLQGDIYQGYAGETFLTPDPASPPDFVQIKADDTALSGGNLLARWTRTFSAQSEFALQSYFDAARNWDSITGQDRKTFDINFQHRLEPIQRHHLVWGLGYRTSRDSTNSGIIAFSPAGRHSNLFTTFAYDDLTLIEDKISLVLGAQLEHNDYTDFEFQPTLRMIWTPRPYQTLWGAVSRAVRTPSRAETGIIFKQPVIATPGGPLQPALVGNPGFKSEEVWSTELGGRWRARPQLFLDLSFFYNQYNGLLSVDPRAPQIAVPADIDLPLVASNALDARSFGAELIADLTINPWWKLQSTYTYLRVLLDLDPAANYQGFKETAAAYPKHQYALRSNMDLNQQLECDLALRYVGDISAATRKYLALDARLDWHPCDQLHLELIGHNLLDPQHPEAASEYLAASALEVDRSLFARATWKF